MSALGRPAGDLRDLRREHESISGRLLRFDFVRLSFFSLLVFSFASAFEEIDAPAIAIKRKEATELEEAIKKGQQLLGSERARAATPAPSLPSPKPAPSIGEPAIDAAKIDEKKEQLRILEADIENEYRRAFRLRVPLPGADVQIDLRVWVYALPFLFVLSEVYAIVLLRRAALLRRIAAHRMNSIPPKEAETLDGLLFGTEPGRATPWVRHPNELLRILARLTFVALGVYLVVSGRPFWASWSGGAGGAVAIVLLTLTFYAVAYCEFVREQLDSQAEHLLEIPRPETRTTRVWTKAKAYAARAYDRVNLPLSMGTGAALVLTSLFTTTSVDACWGFHRGIDLARGWAPDRTGSTDSGGADSPSFHPESAGPRPAPVKVPVYWLGIGAVVEIVREDARSTGRPFRIDPDLAYHEIQRALYVVGLLMAAITPILYVICRWRRRSRAAGWSVGLAAAVCAGLSFHLLSDIYVTVLALLTDTPKLLTPLLWSWAFFWLVPWLSWLAYRRTGREKREERWPPVRDLLAVLCLPLSLVATPAVALALAGGLGVAFHFLGVQLLQVSVLKLSDTMEARPGAAMPGVPP